MTRSGVRGLSVDEARWRSHCPGWFGSVSEQVRDSVKRDSAPRGVDWRQWHKVVAGRRSSERRRCFE